MIGGLEKSEERLNLLWPPGWQVRTDRQLSTETIRDLALETLVTGMCPNNLHQERSPDGFVSFVPGASRTELPAGDSQGYARTAEPDGGFQGDAAAVGRA